MVLFSKLSFFLTPIKVVFYFIKLKIIYKGKVSFIFGTRIKNGSYFEGCNTLGEKSVFAGKMGYGSYLSSRCKIEGKIGRYTSIAPDVVCSRGVHPYRSPYVATSPMFYSTNRITGDTYAKKNTFNDWKDEIEIGNDVWIGERAFLTGNIKIGDGAVVYSCAVVTKDVPPYAIVAGVPAKIIGYRYDQTTIDFLLKFQWWNKSPEWLRKHWMLLNDIEQLKKYESKYKE